jgi:hypothetical protein
VFHVFGKHIEVTTSPLSGISHATLIKSAPAGHVNGSNLVDPLLGYYQL